MTREKPQVNLDEVLETLRRFARGELVDQGRDVVAERIHITSGALEGDELPLELDRDGDRLRLRVGEGEVHLTLRTTGEFIFSYGEVALTCASPAAGAAFVDAVAAWLGVPLQPEAVGATGGVTLDHVLLGRRRDADGVDWDLYKLCLGREERFAEVFLRTRVDGRGAALTEKDSGCRLRLVTLLDAAVGGHRVPAPHRVLSLDGGVVQLALAPDWPVSREPACVVATDPGDACRLEVSWSILPLPAGALPPCDQRLEEVMQDAGVTASETGSGTRGELAFAWADYPYASEDAHRSGIRRDARGRWLVAAKGRVQALVFYYYWVEDAAWALPAWEGILGTLRLSRPRRPGPPALEFTAVARAPDPERHPTS
jgi:hypothetical protein